MWDGVEFFTQVSWGTLPGRAQGAPGRDDTRKGSASLCVTGGPRGGSPLGGSYRNWGLGELMVAEPGPQDTGGSWLQGIRDERASRSYGRLGSGSFLGGW